MKENLSKLTILLALGSGVISCAQQNIAAQRPNILLIVSDDEDRDRVGCYGGAVYTPHIDSIALNGVRFTNATVLQDNGYYTAYIGKYHLAEHQLLYSASQWMSVINNQKAEW